MAGGRGPTFDEFLREMARVNPSGGIGDVARSLIPSSREDENPLVSAITGTLPSGASPTAKLTIRQLPDEPPLGASRFIDDLLRVNPQLSPSFKEDRRMSAKEKEGSYVPSPIVDGRLSMTDLGVDKVKSSPGLKTWVDAIGELEGGIQFHKSDRGNKPSPMNPRGVTKFGISSAANPDIRVADITHDEAVQLYVDRYWMRGNLDVIDSVSPKVATAIMDDMVNSGVTTGAKDLQRIVGAKADGIIGPKTAEATQAFIDEFGEDELISRLSDRRLDRFKRLASTDKSQAGNLRGWRNRLSRLERTLSSSSQDLSGIISSILSL